MNEEKISITVNQGCILDINQELLGHHK